MPGLIPRLIFTIVMMPLVIAAGCVERPTTIDVLPERNHSDTTLRILVTRPTDQPRIAELATAWALRTGAKVQVVSGKVDETADVVILPPADVARLATADKLSEVPLNFRETANPYRWEDIFPVYQSRILTYGGKTLALPVVAEALVLVYRTDLIETAQVPRTWEDLVAVAEILGPESVTPVNPPDARMAEFFSAAASYDKLGVARLNQGELIREDFFTFQFDLKSGKPRLATPAFRHAADVFSKLARFRCRSTTSAGEAIRTGKSKLGVIPLGELAKVGDDMAPKLGVAPVPGSRITFDANGAAKATEQNTLNRVPYLGWGGLVAVVPTSSKFSVAAWDFAAELGNPDRTALELIADVRWGAGAYRISQVDTRARARWSSYGLSGPETDRLPAALRETLAPGVQNYRICFRSADHELFARALDAELLPLMNGDKPAAVAVTSAQAAWEALVATVPPAEWKATLRKSLGLN